jgi:hypothetical protein
MGAHPEDCACDDCRPVFRREEIVELHRWRQRCFRELGFTRVDAEHLDLAEVDLHRMIDLLEQGCPKELAEKILV